MTHVLISPNESSFEHGLRYENPHSKRHLPVWNLVNSEVLLVRGSGEIGISSAAVSELRERGSCGVYVSKSYTRRNIGDVPFAVVIQRGDCSSPVYS